MAQVARDAGLSRESLYKALSGQRSPGFDTILKVIAALGLKRMLKRSVADYAPNLSLNPAADAIPPEAPAGVVVQPAYEWMLASQESPSRPVTPSVTEVW